MTEEQETEFTIKVKMKDRWVPHFLAMLRAMQTYGEVGMSRTIGILADGDGDFRPKFEWSDELPSDAQPIENDGDLYFDAG